MAVPTFELPQIDATMEGAGWRWPISYEDPARTIARVEMTWRRIAPTVSAWTITPGHLIDRRTRGADYAVVGSLLDLVPGATYQGTLRAYDAADVRIGAAYCTWTQRQDNVEPHADLVARATRHVRMDGDDSNDGLTTLSAWRTLQKAKDASPAGAVVLVGPGYFQRATPADHKRTQPITFVAEYPSVVGVEAETLVPTFTPPGLRSVVYGQFVAPAASDLPEDAERLGAWEQVEVEGVRGEGAHTLWRADVGTVDVGAISWRHAGTGCDYAAEKAGKQRRLAHWQSRARIPTVNEWATVLMTNLSYRYGAFQVYGESTMYLRLPGDINPNECYFWYGRGTGTDPHAECGFNLAASDCRISGFSFRGLSNNVRLAVGHHRLTLDGCVSDCSRTPLLINGSDESTLTADDVLVQDCYVRGTDVVKSDEIADAPVPWATVKVGPIDPQTGTYWVLGGSAKPKPLGGLENAAVSWRYGGRRTIVRRCIVEGIFNGFSGTAKHPTDIQSCDLVDILCRNIADNAWEPEGDCENVRVVRCRAERCNTPFASALDGGPIYAQDCVSWRCNHRLLGPIRTDVPNEVYTGGASAWKFGSSQDGIVVENHCTHWNDELRLSGSGTDGYDAASGSSLGTVWMQAQNIVRATGKVYDGSGVRHITDCCEAGEHDATHCAEIDAGLVDPTNGDLTPIPGGHCDGRGSRVHTGPVPAVGFA